MKTIFKYIEFFEIETTGKTRRFLCKNKKSGDLLAGIKWFSPWRQYCAYFMAESTTVGDVIMNSQCLGDLREFMDELNSEHGESK